MKKLSLLLALCVCSISGITEDDGMEMQETVGEDMDGGLEGDFFNNNSAGVNQMPGGMSQMPGGDMGAMPPMMPGMGGGMPGGMNQMSGGDMGAMPPMMPGMGGGMPGGMNGMPGGDMGGMPGGQEGEVIPPIPDDEVEIPGKFEADNGIYEMPEDEKYHMTEEMMDADGVPANMR